MTNACSKCISQITDKFDANPTAENYVKLRRARSDTEIDVRFNAVEVLEWVYEYGSKHWLDDFEIDTHLLAEAVCGNRPAICELSVSLLELIIPRDNAGKRGRTHLVSRGDAVSDALVNELINFMIDGLSDADDPSLPSDLVVLIRHQTGGVYREWQKERALRERKQQASRLALDMAFDGKVPTVRAVASEMNVDPSTVFRWLDGGLQPLRQLALLAKKGLVKRHKAAEEEAE